MNLLKAVLPKNMVSEKQMFSKHIMKALHNEESGCCEEQRDVAISFIIGML